MILLLVCSRDEDAVQVQLVRDAQIVGEERVPFDSGESQELLPTIEKVLVSQNASLDELSRVFLVQGAERFTVSRLSAVVANALGWSLGIPVNGLDEIPSLEELGRLEVATGSIEAVYSKEPTIG